VRVGWRETARGDESQRVAYKETDGEAKKVVHSAPHIPVSSDSNQGLQYVTTPFCLGPPMFPHQPIYIRESIINADGR
jgi:hypothetical protein